MKVKNSHLIKLILFLFNFINFVKASFFINNNGDLDDVEASGMDMNLMPLDIPLNRKSNYEQTIYMIEEKIRSLSRTFNQLELKIDYLLYDNMGLFGENLPKIFKQIVEEKQTVLDKKIDVILESITKIKTPYNVQEQKCANNRLPTNCQDLNTCNSHVYSLMVPQYSYKPFPAVCDFKTLDGGWTVIQRRQDGSENFYRNWTDYVEGFGNLNGEFFIGLEKLHILTTRDEPQELYIILEDFEGQRRYARYGQFKVDSGNTNYTLTVGKHTGNAGDCFSKHSGHKFTTKDRDNDASSINCAQRSVGAWWYSDCFYSNLNGLYLAGKIPKSKRGMSWCIFRDSSYSLKFVQMMIRPKVD